MSACSESNSNPQFSQLCPETGEECKFRAWLAVIKPTEEHLETLTVDSDCSEGCSVAGALIRFAFTGEITNKN